MTLPILFALLGAASSPTSESVDTPFTLHTGQPVQVGSLKLELKVRQLPLQRGPGGMELFPATYYDLVCKEGGKELTLSMVSSRELFDRYTITLSGMDEHAARVTVQKRVCTIWYTTSNQLENSRGEVIFDQKDPMKVPVCCQYSDGTIANTCDLQATRASRPAQPSVEKFCTIYALRKGASNNPCCCRYERGEAIEPACEIECQGVLDQKTSH